MSINPSKSKQHTVPSNTNSSVLGENNTQTQTQVQNESQSKSKLHTETQIQQQTQEARSTTLWLTLIPVISTLVFELPLMTSLILSLPLLAHITSNVSKAMQDLYFTISTPLRQIQKKYFNFPGGTSLFTLIMTGIIIFLFYLININTNANASFFDYFSVFLLFLTFFICYNILQQIPSMKDMSESIKSLFTAIALPYTTSSVNQLTSTTKKSNALDNDLKSFQIHSLPSESTKSLTISKSLDNQLGMILENPELSHARSTIEYFWSFKLNRPPSRPLIGHKQIYSYFTHVLKTPFQHPDIFRGVFSPPSAILLFGHPGCGKTHLVHSLLHINPNYTLFSLSSSALISKWQGQSAKMIRILFLLASYCSPSIIFIDEIDSLCRSRESSESDATRRIKNELLQALSDLDSRNASSSSANHVLFIGCTNRPQDLDTAFLRRFQERFLVPLPKETEVVELLKSTLGPYFSDLPADKPQYLSIAKSLIRYNFSHSDIVAWCSRVAKTRLPHILSSLQSKIDIPDSILSPSVLAQNVPSPSSLDLLPGNLITSENVSKMAQYNASYGTSLPSDTFDSVFANDLISIPVSVTTAVDRVRDLLFVPSIPIRSRGTLIIQILNNTNSFALNSLKPTISGGEVLSLPKGPIPCHKRGIFAFNLAVGFTSDFAFAGVDLVPIRGSLFSLPYNTDSPGSGSGDVSGAENNGSSEPLSSDELSDSNIQTPTSSTDPSQYLGTNSLQSVVTYFEWQSKSVAEVCIGSWMSSTADSDRNWYEKYYDTSHWGGRPWKISKTHPHSPRSHNRGNPDPYSKMAYSMRIPKTPVEKPFKTMDDLPSMMSNIKLSISSSMHILQDHGKFSVFMIIITVNEKDIVI